MRKISMIFTCLMILGCKMERVPGDSFSFVLTCDMEWLREYNRHGNTLPDMENQRFRHAYDCLNQYPENRDRFVSLLQAYHVNAYIFGHTHNYSIVKINVRGKQLEYETCRINYDQNEYEIADRGHMH